jgi:ribosomal protein S18 acetylase RimI-like enzyme
MSLVRHKVEVRNTTAADIPQVIELSRMVYPASPPWSQEQLASHLGVFPEGQFVAVDRESRQVVGMAASLIVLWDDYDMQASWREFTDNGTFRNHDPLNGRTLYGAEVIVWPKLQGGGIGKALYRARRNLTERLGLLRIRAGARLRDYHRFASKLSAEEYVVRVVRGEIRDRTLSFQLRQGFDVIAVVSGYLRHDPESLGYAAVIEWINHRVAHPEDYSGRDPRFRKPSPSLVRGGPGSSVGES